MAVGAGARARTVSSPVMLRALQVPLVLVLSVGFTVGLAGSARGQTFEGPGTRARGMAAFVAVADDASAVYWNPAGLASGSYFSLVMDYTEADATPSDAVQGGERSSWLLALAAPAFGVCVLPPGGRVVRAGRYRCTGRCHGSNR